MAAKQFKNRLKTKLKGTSDTTEATTIESVEYEDDLYTSSFYSGHGAEDCINIADVPFEMDSTFLDKIAGCYDGPRDLESIKKKERNIPLAATTVANIGAKFVVSRQRIDTLIHKAVQKLDFLVETGYSEPLVKLAEILVEEFVNELDEAESVESFLKTYCKKHLKPEDLKMQISELDIEILREVKELCVTSFKQSLEICEYFMFAATPDEEEIFPILRLVVGNQLSARLKKLEVEAGFSNPVGRPKVIASESKE